MTNRTNEMTRTFGFPNFIRRIRHSANSWIPFDLFVIRLICEFESNAMNDPSGWFVFFTRTSGIPIVTKGDAAFPWIIRYNIRDLLFRGTVIFKLPMNRPIDDQNTWLMLPGHGGNGWHIDVLYPLVFAQPWLCFLRECIFRSHPALVPGKQKTPLSQYCFSDGRKTGNPDRWSCSRCTWNQTCRTHHGVWW